MEQTIIYIFHSCTTKKSTVDEMKQYHKMNVGWSVQTIIWIFHSCTI
jgi:hypothetical protein